jgi:hypothetical protein
MEHIAMNGRDNPGNEPMTAAGTEYAQHLESLQARFSSALIATGHDAAEGAFGPASTGISWWSELSVPAPAQDCCVFVKAGSRPKLLICAPPDIWYAQATIPTGDWTGNVELQLVASRAEARAALPQDLSRVALSGEAGAELSNWGVAALNP